MPQNQAPLHGAADDPNKHPSTPDPLIQEIDDLTHREAYPGAGTWAGLMPYLQEQPVGEELAYMLSNGTSGLAEFDGLSYRYC